MIFFGNLSNQSPEKTNYFLGNSSIYFTDKYGITGLPVEVFNLIRKYNPFYFS